MWYLNNTTPPPLFGLGDGPPTINNQRLIIMKSIKTLILLTILITLSLMSCERKSGRLADKVFFTVEFLDTETKDISHYTYSDRSEALYFQSELDRQYVWNTLIITKREGL